MNASDLDILVGQGDGTTLEYKEALSSSFAREIVALANTAGGRILVGVADDGTVTGVPDSNDRRARIQDIARNCDPPVKVLVERVGEVTVITVRESDAKPVQCRDGFFWRQGAVTQKLSRNEIRDFFRSEGSIRFDLSPCPRFRYPEDFDREKYLRWLHQSGISWRCVTRTAWRIETLRREDVPEYPMKALREAITNAIMHRDWFIEGANVFVELYTDRIEVTSPGGLPKGMRLSDLGRKSVRRNPLIADLLHRIELVEKAGTGIRRMRGDAIAQGCPEPEFEVTGFFTTVFRPNPAVRTRAAAQEGAVTPTQSPTQSTDPVMRLLGALQQGPASAGDLRKTLAIKHRPTFRSNYLHPALEAGFIELTIPDKPTSRLQQYRLTAAGRDALTESEES